MASSKHDFIVSALVRKMRQDGFGVKYMDGRYHHISLHPYSIPPSIIRHRPDVIAEGRLGAFAIGEAKTENDIFTERTRSQFVDFHWAITVGGNKLSRLYIGVPLNSKSDLANLLHNLRIKSSPLIEVLYIPEGLMTNDEEPV